VNIETEAFFDNPVTNITFPFGAAALESIDGAFNNYDALESLGIIIDQDNVADSRFREVPLPGLQICYSVNGRKAGTYTWDGKTEQWSKTK
jgi:hypothetical protein